MSDYLGRLSERALGIANLVQPAIAPLFASAPTPTAFPISEEENDPNRSNTTNEFPRVTVSSVAAPINERTVMVRSPVEINEEKPLEKVNLFPNPSVDANTSNRMLQLKLSLASENANASQTNLGTNFENRHANGAVPPQLPGIVPSPRPADADGVPRADRYLPMSDPMERVDESFEVDPAGPTPLKPPVRRISPIAGNHELTTDDAPNVDTQRLMVQLRSRGATTTPRTMQSDQNAAAPIVRINIGRIEVRAVQPSVAPAPQPRRDTARPSVTLTDYLTKKRGAGR
jgi:hypothetical protein